MNRKWSRHSRVTPVDANVNDLEFYQQTGQTDGYGNGVISKFNSTPASFHYSNPDLLGSVLPIGNACFFQWADLGYTTDPLVGIPNFRDDRTPTDQAAFLASWQDEVAALSKVALRRHYVKLERKKVDLAVELSQGLKTVNQIADIAKRIATSLSNLRKGRVLAAFKVLFPTTPKGAASDFLAWKYGIKPLIGDLQGAAEHLAEYVLRSAPFKSNGHAKQSFTKESTTLYGTSSPFANSGAYEIRKATIRVKYGTSFTIPRLFKRQAATLGFTNPANIAWELLPLSFVVDWFLPIGNWLSSLAALDGLVVKESYKTIFIVEQKTRYTTLHHFNGVTPSEHPFITTFGSDRGTDGYLFWEFLSFTSTRKTIYCKREVLTLPDVPLPTLKNPISKGHINSAVALFLQLSSTK
jgi:hypothetical protein